jgi:LmbE family N-acetylglucosaminyl deacetylase
MTPQELFAAATAAEHSTCAAPKALLVFAHPDDEVIALGARIGRFTNAHLIHVTDGAPRNEQDSRAHGFNSWAEYRDGRLHELECALRLAGLEHMSRECLGIPDQQAAFRLAELACALRGRIERHQPQIVFTHPYEGGHPDHDAIAFAVHMACRLSRTHSPIIIECALYHAGPHGIETATFLPAASPTAEITHTLSPEEQRRKQAMIQCFTTQRDTLAYFSLAEERYRIAPQYEFTQPPHPAPVWYDKFPWGMTSDRFCQLAGEAQNTLLADQEAACR